MFDPENPKTYFDNDAIAWPYEFWFTLVSQAIILPIIGTNLLLSRMNMLHANNLFALGCVTIVGALFMQCFMIVYGLTAAILGTRWIVPGRRTVYLLIMLMPLLSSLALVAFRLAEEHL